METYAIYSAGGFAREVKRAFELRQKLISDNDFECVFIDDNMSDGTQLNGVRVISYEAAKSIDKIKFCIGFADPKLRKTKAEKCEADGFEFFSITAPSTIIYDDVDIGIGAIMADNTMVTANAKIGLHFHCNIYSYVAHDCIVGDYVTLAPRVSLNGRIKVEDGVYVGSDATFLPGNASKFLTIGEGAVIGAGALVTKDVDPYTTVVGSPAKPLTKKS